MSIHSIQLYSDILLSLGLGLGLTQPGVVGLRVLVLMVPPLTGLRVWVEGPWTLGLKVLWDLQFIYTRTEGLVGSSILSLSLSTMAWTRAVVLQCNLILSEVMLFL